MKFEKNETLKSGDNVGRNITCHNCGEKFRNGKREGTYVSCPDCGGRCAYVVVEE